MVEKINEEKKYEKDKFYKKRILFIIFFSIIIILIGIIVTIFFTKKIEDETKINNLSYASIFTAAINPTRVFNLTNDEKDLENPDYQRLEEQFIKMEGVGKSLGIRWIYTLFERNGNIIFGPDSIPKGEYGHSEPGAIYADPSLLMKKAVSNIFSNGNTEILGPDTDIWGTWLSVLVPIKDFQTGKVIGVLGIDIDYSYYQSIIFRRQLLPIIFSIFILILYLLISFYFLRIKKITEKLKEGEEKYKNLYKTSINNSQKIEEDLDKMRILSFDIERMNKLMIGRELEMIKLKEEIVKLKVDNK